MEDDGGVIPADFLMEIDNFDKLIVWKRTMGGTKDTEIPEPKPGLDTAFDEANL